MRSSGGAGARRIAGSSARCALSLHATMPLRDLLTSAGAPGPGPGAAGKPRIAFFDLDGTLAHLDKEVHSLGTVTYTPSDK